MNLKLLSFISAKISGKSSKARFVYFTSAMAVLSITLGTVALILSLSILEGFDSTLHQNATRFTSHITLQTFNRSPIELENAKITSLKDNFQEISEISPVITSEGLIKGKKSLEGISIRGIDSLGFLSVNDFIVKGEKKWNNYQGNSILLSTRLADKIGVDAGDDILIFVPRGNSYSSFPDTKVKKYKIAGLYRSGMVQYDDIYVYMNFSSAAKLSNMPEKHSTLLQINLRNADDAKKIVNDIETYLGYPYFGFTVFDVHSAIFAWIELQKEPIPIILGLISLVASLNIITTILVLILEKVNSIGILRALGLSGKRILLIFITRGIRLGLYGTITGSLISFIFSLLQINFEIIKLKGEIYFLDSLPVVINVWHYIIVFATTMFLTLIVSTIPAVISARIPIVKSIKFK